MRPPKRAQRGRTHAAIGAGDAVAERSPAPLTPPPSKAETPERPCDHLHAQRRAHQVPLRARRPALPARVGWCGRLGEASSAVDAVVAWAAGPTCGMPESACGRRSRRAGTPAREARPVRRGHRPSSLASRRARGGRSRRVGRSVSMRPTSMPGLGRRGSHLAVRALMLAGPRRRPAQCS